MMLASDANSQPFDDGLRLPSAGLSIDDWGCLLAAVAARLRATAAEAPRRLHNGAGNTLQASVLECADALEQLHDTLRSTLGDAQPTVKAPEGDRGAAAQL